MFSTVADGCQCDQMLQFDDSSQLLLFGAPITLASQRRSCPSHPRFFFVQNATTCCIQRRTRSIAPLILHAVIAITRRRQNRHLFIKIISFLYKCNQRSLLFKSLFSERKHIATGLASDPTLPRTRQCKCPKCGHTEAVFFQTHDRRRDTPMTLNYVCCNPACNHVWSDLRKR